MNFNLNKFVEDVARDNELCREFSKFEEMDEIYSYCKNMGIECTEDEFDESVSEYIYSLDDNNHKIDDDNLNSVAGGINFTNPISKTLAVVLSALTLGGSGFYGNVSAEEVSDFTNSSYKSEKVNSGKWSRTKKAISKFYNNHKKAIGLTLGATIITGGILYNNHKVNNYKKELSGMSDEDIMEKIGKILPKDVRHKDSNKQLPEKNDKEDKKTKELKTGSKSHLEDLKKKDKPLIDSSQNETPKTTEEKPVEVQKKTDASHTVDEKHSSVNVNDTKTSKSEQDSATEFKKEEIASDESKKSKEISIIDKEPDKPDTTHEPKKKQIPSTEGEKSKESILNQATEGVKVKKLYNPKKASPQNKRKPTQKLSEIARKIGAELDTKDSPKEIDESTYTTNEEKPIDNYTSFQTMRMGMGINNADLSKVTLRKTNK